MIFVDTGAWFASVVPSDRDHAAATRWLSQNTQPLITTNYIVDETLTLLKARGQTSRAIAMGEQFFRGTLATIYYLTEADILLSWQTFCQFYDKAWSFTDCTSKVFIDKLHLQQAFAFDHHFHQFGSVEVVP
jgi:predicted nucleic acid-binding protein